MNKKMLWAPWRIKYIQSQNKGKCIFCLAKKSKSKEYVLFRTPYSIALLNIYPYNNGHTMVCPQRHIKDLVQLTETETMDLIQSINKTKSLLDKVLKPHGYNIGMNLSRSSGAGITGHLHIHIVPRWNGDANFMLTVSDTKVISQSLKELVKELRDAYAKTNC